MNLFNMYDGINLQSGLYLLFLCSLFIFKNIEIIFYFFFNVNIFCLIIKEIFLGNGGVYFYLFYSQHFSKGN